MKPRATLLIACLLAAFLGFTPTVVLAQEADLELKKTDKPDPVGTGEVLIYMLTVINHGPDTTGVALLDDIPEGTSLIRSTTWQGSCSFDDVEQRVNCDLGDLAPGDSTMVLIAVRAPDEPGILTNSAEVEGSAFDPDEGNNVAEETTTVRPVDAIDPLNSEATDLKLLILPIWMGIETICRVIEPNLLEGPTLIRRYEDDLVDIEGDEVARIPTEIVQLRLDGFADCDGLGVVPMRIRESRFKASLGAIFPTFVQNGEPFVDEDHPADSFFDVFPEIVIDLGPFGRHVLYARNPIRLGATIRAVPPLGEADFVDVEGYVGLGWLNDECEAGMRNPPSGTTLLPTTCEPDDPTALRLFDPGPDGIPDTHDDPEEPHALLFGHPRHTPISHRDDRRPRCELIELVWDSHVEVEVQDSESGIMSIEIVDIVNATSMTPDFNMGTQAPIRLRANKTTPGIRAFVLWEITDWAGNVRRCDPVITTLEGGSPEVFALEQNFPNPFGENTTVRFHVPETAHVTLEVFDVLGRSVAVLIDEELAPGTYTAAWDGATATGLPLADGTYVYRFTAGTFSETKVMTLMK